MKHSIYIHIPFCTHRCAYCDFNTYAGQEQSIPAYVEALRREIEWVSAAASARLHVHTVFFGGGTPSLLSPDQFASILQTIRDGFDLTDGAEITTEANPGTVSPASLQGLREAGVNRISFGAQSANGEELRMLERAHTFFDVMEAVRAARMAGFDNLNLDLIYGLPEQQLETWQMTVQRVLDLHPEHVSAYALTLEHGTPFGRWSTRGLMAPPDPDAAAEMYEWAGDVLESAGYKQYEISNWGRGDGPEADVGEAGGSESPEYACRHNLQYWRCQPYLGFGAGAHGYANGYRYSNVLRIKTYIERMREQIRANAESGKARFPLSPAAVNQHRQSEADDMSEFMITGLRLTQEGISANTFRDRFGRDLTEAYGEQLEQLVRVELLEWVDSAGCETLRLTKRGRLLGNQVFMRFV